MTATSTFSQSITGFAVGSLFGGQPTINNFLIPDASVDGINLGTTGGIQVAAQQGSAVLAKGPDGAFHWYRIRSVGANGGGTFSHPALEFVGP
jgi:hypothetical protein